GGQRSRASPSRDGDPPKELEVPECAAEVRIRVDDEAVSTGGWQPDLLGDPPVGADGRVIVDDRAEIATYDDQVHTGVRPGAGAIARQRCARGLVDRERQSLGPVRHEPRRRKSASRNVRAGPTLIAPDDPQP